MESSKLVTYSGKWFIPHTEVELPGILTIDGMHYIQILKLYSEIAACGTKPESHILYYF